MGTKWTVPMIFDGWVEPEGFMGPFIPGFVELGDRLMLLTKRELSVIKAIAQVQLAACLLDEDDYIKKLLQHIKLCENRPQNKVVE